MCRTRYRHGANIRRQGLAVAFANGLLLHGSGTVMRESIVLEAMTCFTSHFWAHTLTSLLAAESMKSSTRACALSASPRLVHTWTYVSIYTILPILNSGWKLILGWILVLYVFTMYLSDLFIGVGFVTGETFTTHLWIAVFCFVCVCVGGGSTFKLGLLFLRDIALFLILTFSWFSATLIPECVYRP